MTTKELKIIINEKLKNMEKLLNKTIEESEDEFIIKEEIDYYKQMIFEIEQIEEEKKQLKRNKLNLNK